jgi:carboxymethylenebutenolidase
VGLIFEPNTEHLSARQVRDGREGENTLIEAEIAIPTADGSADAFLYIPERDGPRPGVLFLTDIGGIRESQSEIARRIAAEGYVVLMPNLFYRTSRPPVLNLPFNPRDEQFMQRLRELSSPLTPEAVERDAASYVDFLAAQKPVKHGPMGTFGLCFAGAVAMRVAAARPDQIGAAASFHGGRLYTDAPSSPHLLLPRIKARLYFGHAINDASMPQEAIDKLHLALKDWGGKYESEVYEGALHGWTVRDHPAYNPTQAERAVAKLKQLFAETIG